MGTEIRTWQITDGKLGPIETTLGGEGHVERHLEDWLASNPEIIGADLLVIGRQVSTKSGPIDLLAMDKSGNTVIIEIKRGELPRESLAQAIDYASDVKEWTRDRLSEVCVEHTKKALQDAFDEKFDVDLEEVSINGAQRIVLVGFSIESSLERMIEWLSDSYGVSINAVVLSYVKTRGGDELLTKTSIISEEMEQERTRKQKKFEIPMSDDPGGHDRPRLKQLLLGYLSKDRVTRKRLRDIIFPALLKTKSLTRDQLKKALVDSDEDYDESKVGYFLSLVSSQLGMKKNDFLRQVVAYSKPRNSWEKDNFSIREEYRDLVGEVLSELRGKE